jgi:RimJ/RimL family protein N-acetyltransferase
MKNGARFVIRNPEPSDAAAMVEYLNRVGGESNYLLFGRNEFRLSVEEEANYLRNIGRDDLSAMIIAVYAGEIVGIAHLSGSNRKRIAHNAELGLSVAKKYWNLGVGSALMSEAIVYARDTDKIKIINLTVYDENKRAVALYKKFGFEIVGHYPKQICIDGTYYDTTQMNLYLF